MRQMREQGATFKQIAEMFGRTEYAVAQKFVEKGWTNPKPKGEVRDAQLSDFKPRDMIKYLYGLGYRIENNRLVLVRKEFVNMKSILEDA